MRAGMRSHRDVEMPIMATTMPSTRPSAVAATEMIRVLRRPVPSIWGSTCHIAVKSRNVRLMVSNQSMGSLHVEEDGAPGGPATDGGPPGRPQLVCSAEGRYWSGIG